MKDKYITVCHKCGNNCEFCHWADECDKWLENGGDYIPAIPVTTASMALCKGRHEIPQAEDGAIFDKEINPLDVYGLEREAMVVLGSMRPEHLDLYVTGLTVALVSVLNAARALEISVTLYHYDRETGSYYPQEVV